MLESIDFTPLAKELLEVVISLCVVCITTYVIPWVKAKLSEKQLEYVKMIVEFFVKAAEQTYSREDGAQKKQYALEKIQAALNERKIKIDVAELDALLEAAVLELHNKLTEE